MEQFNFGPAKVQVADELNSKVDKNQGSQHAGKVLGIGNDGAVTPVPFAGLDTKVDKNQGVQHAGKALGIGNDGMVTPVAFSGEDFTGATATTNGVHGYVPAPLAGEQAKVLTGDGTWQVSPGAKVYVKTITVTNTSGAYSQTFEDDNIVADMKAVELEATRAYVFGDVITVTPADGSITVACNDVSGTDTIKISLIKVISDPTAITSTEFDILNNRLLAVENVYTDTDISIAATDWTLSNGVYSYTWASTAVTAICGIEVFLKDGADNAGICDFDYSKVANGVQFTTNETPSGNLPLTIRIINCKSTDIDDFRGTIDISFTIPADGWSSTSPYTYTWTNQYITSDCGVDIEFFSRTGNDEVSYLEYEKVANGVLFTSTVKPTTGIPVCAHIVNTLTYNYTTLTADMVSTDAISGAANADEAFTELDSKCTTNEQAIANMNISAISSSTTIASLCSSCPAGQHRYYFIADSNTLTDYPSATRLYRVLLSIHKIDGSNNRADIEIMGKTGSDVPWMFVGIYENGTMYWSQLTGTISQNLSTFVIPLVASKSANVVTVTINYTQAKEALSKNTEKILGALPEAYRPSSAVYTSCLLTDNVGNLVAYLRISVNSSNGNIYAYPSAAISTSQFLFGSFTYCI